MSAASNAATSADAAPAAALPVDTEATGASQEQQQPQPQQKRSWWPSMPPPLSPKTAAAAQAANEAAERAAKGLDDGDGSISRKTYYFKEAEQDMEYALFVPTGYRRESPAPLVVMLHGLFSNPHQAIRYLGLTCEAEKRGHLVVAPFGYNDRSWYGSRGRTMPNFPGRGAENAGELSEMDVINVIGEVRKDYSIDPCRIYLMGHSMGGGGTLHLGAAYPELFAALAPMSPPIWWTEEDVVDKAQSLQSMPILVVTGEKDFVTPAAPIRNLVSSLKANGVDITYNELPGAGHAAPSLRPAVMASIFDFFDDHSRAEAAPSTEGLQTSWVKEMQQRIARGEPPVKVTLSQQPRRPWMAKFFRMLGHLQARTVKVELWGWSAFYHMKDSFWGTVKYLRG